MLQVQAFRLELGFTHDSPLCSPTSLPTSCIRMADGTTLCFSSHMSNFLSVSVYVCDVCISLVLFFKVLQKGERFHILVNLGWGEGCSIHNKQFSNSSDTNCINSNWILTLPGEKVYLIDYGFSPIRLSSFQTPIVSPGLKKKKIDLKGKKKEIYFMDISMLIPCIMYIYHVHVGCQRRLEEDVRSPRN